MIVLRPEAFTLVDYDPAEVRRLAEEAAAHAGLAAVDVEVEIDEELPHPVTASSADVVEGRGRIWMSGGNLEDPRTPRTLEAEVAATELTAAMLRVHDRLTPGFAAAPPDDELGERERASWDVWAYGRCERLGLAVREQRSRYAMRLAHGFTDVADAAFEHLRKVDEVTFEDLVAIGEETAAVDPRPEAKRAVRKPNLRERVS